VLLANCLDAVNGCAMAFIEQAAGCFAAEFDHRTDRIIANGSKMRSSARRYAAPNSASIEHNHKFVPLRRAHRRMTGRRCPTR
jgi:hypothetical protein